MTHRLGHGLQKTQFVNSTFIGLSYEFTTRLIGGPPVEPGSRDSSSDPTDQFHGEKDRSLRRTRTVGNTFPSGTPFLVLSDPLPLGPFHRTGGSTLSPGRTPRDRTCVEGSRTSPWALRLYDLGTCWKGIQTDSGRTGSPYIFI